MAQTERFRYVFTVKEFGDGTPWIALEPYDGNLSCLGDSLLGFDLKAGTDIRKAQEIASLLNRSITTVVHTRSEPSDDSR